MSSPFARLARRGATRPSLFVVLNLAAVDIMWGIDDSRQSTTRRYLRAWVPQNLLCLGDMRRRHYNENWHVEAVHNTRAFSAAIAKEIASLVRCHAAVPSPIA